jgi:ADP-ribose pyrophosphatase
MKIRGPWKVKKTRVVYKNKWMSVREDSVIRPDGKSGIYGVATMLSGVGVIAIDDKMNVYLTKEYHYGIGRVTIEAVSGGIESGESKIGTARRELKEEAGLIAKNWTYLGYLHPLTSLVDMKNYLFLARNLKQIQASPEGTEKIEIVKIPFKKAINLIKKGKIIDATTIVALLKADEYLSNKKLV